MKENIITMENKNIGVRGSKVNGDSIKNEEMSNTGAPEKASWWDRQSEGVQLIATIGVAVSSFVALCFVGGTLSSMAKEASARKTLNSEGFKKHDELVSNEYIAKVNRGLFDEPKTLEEAAARVMGKQMPPQIIVLDPYIESSV